MSDRTDALEFQWKTLQRIDASIAVTNTKASVLLAFNTFVFGGVILKADEIFEPMTTTKQEVMVFSILLVIAFSSFLSLVLTLLVVRPNLTSGSRDDHARSNVFFGDIAKQADFEVRTRSMNQDDMLRDLSTQLVTVSRLALSKMVRLRLAFILAAWVQCPMLFGLFMLRAAVAM